MSKVLTPAKRALPSKEASLFKELLTLYETKQLRKGQKAADQILKKFPEHGGANATINSSWNVLLKSAALQKHCA
jgi:hypothetical protein